MLMSSGARAEKTGINLCDQALKDCAALVEAQKKVQMELEAQIKVKDEQLKQAKNRDTIIYKQPAPWLILGGIVSVFNPLIGVPFLAAGLARAL